MLSELIEAIEAITGSPADTVGAPDKGRCAVVSPYTAASFYGDDANLLDVPKAQIDIYTPDQDDGLPEEIMELLQAWHLCYTVEDLRSYDPETNRLRTILQTEVI